MTVLTAQRWPTNGHMISEVSTLGYLHGRVLDCTWGEGVFWNQWQPRELVGCDINPDKAPDIVADFRNLPFADESFDSVVLDPPYKGAGRITPEVDDRYGVTDSLSWKTIYQLYYGGIRDSARVARKYVLLKTQDGVTGGKRRWMTFDFTEYARDYGLQLEDRFDMLGTPRPQPEGRRQVHSQMNYSSLLVFCKAWRSVEGNL